MFACSFSPSLTQGRLLRRGKAAKAAPNAPLRVLRLEPFAMLPHVLEARRIVGRYERESLVVAECECAPRTLGMRSC